MSARSDTRGVIVRLLENIGGRKEVNEYLRHYCSVDSERFAVVTFGPDIVVSKELDEVAGALSFLHQVGLRPIVLVEGRGEPGAEHPREAARVATQKEALELVDALEALGCRSRPITSGVFVAQGVDDTPVLAAIRADQLPIIAVQATNAEGRLVKTTTLAALGSLARHLQPHKIVWLAHEGSLRDGKGERIDAVNLAEDFDRLRPRLAAADRARLEAFRDLLDALPPFSSLSVTSPAHLARELFTHRGAGTLIRRGEAVRSYASFDELDVERLRELVESCFGRALAPSYFADKRCHRVYVSDSYRATAIVTDEGADAPPYLDKYAVTSKAQGEGLGGSVWSRLRADHPRLFWRSRSDNPVNGWYFEQADGAYRSSKWTVFWCGIDGFEDIERCVRLALELPATLVD
jgi:acetylglutamate synthase